MHMSAAEAINTLVAEQNTVVDQLHMVVSSAEDTDEVCPRRVGSRGMRPQPRLRFLDAAEVQPEGSVVTMREDAEPTGEAHESGALLEARSAKFFTGSESGAETQYWR